MKSPFVLRSNPNRQNIAYGVKVVSPDPEFTFRQMVEDVKRQRTEYVRTIIYCQTIKSTTQLYGYFQAELGKLIFADESCDPRKRVVEMFHSRIDELNRNEILKSLSNEAGTIRILIATIAYGMGIDCKGVRTVIHYGPSRNIEAYLQESGRAGRQSSDQCKSVILYSNVMMKHCHENIVEYVRNSTNCRR